MGFEFNFVYSMLLLAVILCLVLGKMTTCSTVSRGITVLLGVYLSEKLTKKIKHFHSAQIQIQTQLQFASQTVMVKDYCSLV